MTRREFTEDAGIAFVGCSLSSGLASGSAQAQTRRREVVVSGQHS